MPRRPPPQILVVDDDASVLDLVSYVLREAGYRVLSARDERSAMAAARSGERIDLLLTDVNVPGAGGRRLAARIGALHPHAALLYMSGFADAAVVEGGIVTDAPTFLRKPFALSELKQAVEALVGSPTGPVSLVRGS